MIARTDVSGFLLPFFVIKWILNFLNKGDAKNEKSTDEKSPADLRSGRKGNAIVESASDVSNDVLKEAIEAKDYKVLEIQ